MPNDKTYLVFNMDFFDHKNNSLFYDDNAVEKYDLMPKQESSIYFPFYYTVDVNEGGSHTRFITALEMHINAKINKSMDDMYYLHYKQHSILPVHISNKLAEDSIRSFKNLSTFTNNKTNCKAWSTGSGNTIVGIPMLPKVALYKHIMDIM